MLTNDTKAVFEGWVDISVSGTMRQLIGLLFIIRQMVVCQITGDLRLNNSTRYYEGRLEIYLNGTWGTVCDDHFSDIDAAVACRQLGYRTGIVVSSNIITDGFGIIWLDDVSCTGTESKLMNCTYTEKHNCGHNEDVGIRCVPLCLTFGNGGLSIWSVWSSCFYEGYQLRTRTCTNPVTPYGGQFCQGHFAEERKCIVSCYSTM
ncbi:PRSS12 [Mytilus coruscus]|uniref:PRSS12 n=1 Tax=Mytilus coruscus TaxID=42192 RepID=A0A6J8AEU5_MYTCO|nr:PRSS12 [Mytilus coruscus]